MSKAEGVSYTRLDIVAVVILDLAIQPGQLGGHGIRVYPKANTVHLGLAGPGSPPRTESSKPPNALN